MNKTMKNKREKMFIQFVYSKARESETLDINNKRKSFIRRNGRYLFSIPFSVIFLCTLHRGYNIGFLQLSASILAILIGLFLTALVFALDKFYTPHNNKKGDYKLEISENDQTRNLEISFEEVVYKNAREKLWQKQSLYYVQKFNVLVGKSVIVGVWALALICLNVMYMEFFNINFADYTFVSVNLKSSFVFIELSLIAIIRFLICYFIIEVFYNTIRIISSMVNFMSVKITK